MAVTNIITGEAIGGNYSTKGDRKQSSVPDYDGEVKLIKRSVRSFLDYLDSSKNQHYKVYRPINPAEARAIAQIAIQACNNPNIGYSQHYEAADPDENRSAIFRRGSDTNVPINCDCSSLGSYCASMATGVNIGSCDSSSIGSALAGTGHFMTAFPVSQLSTSNLPYNGDIFVRSKSDTPTGGHVFMVVSGNPRTGCPDESVTITGGSGVGFHLDIDEYVDQYGQTYKYAPRKDPPEDSNPYFDQTCGITPNGSYAWGRFSEVLRSPCELCRMEPRKWYAYKEDGYRRETAPLVGAVMCYTNIYDIDDPGYVCIVEHLDTDKIDVSLVTLDTEKFEYTTIEKREGSWDLDLNKDGKYEYRFQGFIYNPAVNLWTQSTCIRENFIQVAKDQSGKDGSFTEQYTQISTQNNAWSAAFINAVATAAGNLLNVVIPNTLACSDIGRIGVIRGMGIWISGPTGDTFPQPQTADIVLFRTNSTIDRMNRYAADKAGIVVEVEPPDSTAPGTNETVAPKFKAVIGDYEGKVKTKTYLASSGLISGIFRPRWERVDGTTGFGQYTQIEGLYTEGTSSEDAAIRDLRYVNLTEIGFEPSINSTGLKLCAINYTGMLANLYSSLAEVSSSSGTNSSLVVDIVDTTIQQSTFQEDEDNSKAAVIGKSVSPNMETGTLNINNSTLKTGGSVQAHGCVTTYGNKLTSDVTQDYEQFKSIKVTAIYQELQITKTISLTNTVKTIYNLLYDKLKNPAAVIGVMANMFEESQFQTNNISRATGGCGLLNWTGSKSSKMKAFCSQQNKSKGWAVNIASQINFIFDDSSNTEIITSGLQSMRRVGRNVNGSVRATRMFLDYYILDNPDALGQPKEVEKYNIRSGWAKGLWSLFFGGSRQK